MKKALTFLLLGLFYFTSCNDKQPVEDKVPLSPTTSVQQKLSKYVSFKLTTDLSKLSKSEQKVIAILMKAGDIMNDIYWEEAYGNKAELFAKIEDISTEKFVKLNYGPWDRLDGNNPFIKGVGTKEKGANFYPKDMTKLEFDSCNLPSKTNPYNFVRRNKKGDLITIPFHIYFKEHTKKAASLLLEAASISEDKSFSKYLSLRADALLRDDYFESDMYWMKMKNNHLDIVIGPIETYEDQLYGLKMTHECYILIKDMEWSRKLINYASFLPELQKNLPVPRAYKKEKPSTKTDLNAYDVVFYAGDCNAGTKSIAFNLPNDESVQRKKGTKRFQLKNTMRAKYNHILVPIAKELITKDQQKHITFDAFFANTMFRELAHDLGIKKVIGKKKLTVRNALKEYASTLEEGKADILGLYMISQLHKKGEIQGNLHDYYVTFVASIFRSVRFGVSSAHGRANMIRFNYFRQYHAIELEADGTFRINYKNLEKAVQALTLQLITLQGNGDYLAVQSLVNTMGQTNPLLNKFIKQLSEKNIPVDIHFDQGTNVLGIPDYQKQH